MSTPINLQLPAPAPLMSSKGWATFLVALIIVCAIAPVLNLVVPESSIFHFSDFAISLIGKIMCYAICALAMDLIWGYTCLSATCLPFVQSSSNTLRISRNHAL